MEFYIKKSNGRYEKYADQWEGFPCDGWWFVGDGKRNLVVPIDAPRPLKKLPYQQHRNEIVSRLFGGNTSLSLDDFVEKTLNILEELVDEESKNINND